MALFPIVVPLKSRMRLKLPVYSTSLNCLYNERTKLNNRMFQESGGETQWQIILLFTLRFPNQWPLQ